MRRERLVSEPMKTSPMKMSIAWTCGVVWAGLVLAGGASYADVVPDGQRYVEARNDLSGTASLAGRTLVLVTTNDRVQAQVAIVPEVGDGPIEVPGGYRNSSFLAALTPAELAELDKVRGGRWSYEPASDREAPGPLRAFFDQAGRVTSDPLPFRALVSRGGAARAVRMHWTITGMNADGIQLTVVSEELDAQGAVLGSGGGFLAIALAIGAAAVLGLVVVLVVRRRGRTQPGGVRRAGSAERA